MSTTVAVSRTAQITDANGTVPLDPRTDATEQFLSVTLTGTLTIVLRDPVVTDSVLAPADFDGARFRIIRPADSSNVVAAVQGRWGGASHFLRNVASGEWAEFTWATLGGTTGQWRVVAAGAL